MTLTTVVTAAIRSARLEGEARVFTSPQTRVCEERAGRGLKDFRTPQDVDLPAGTRATFWVGEFRPGVIARHLVLTAMRRDAALSSQDVEAVLRAYGFAYDVEALTKFDGVRYADHDGHAVMVVVEPVSGDLFVLVRDENGLLTRTIDPKDIPVGMPSPSSPESRHLPRSTAHDIAGAIDLMETGGIVSVGVVPHEVASSETT